MAPKYRHRGYRESDSENEGRDQNRPQPHQSLTREERIQRRSLRHAVDREANEVIRCHACGRGLHNLGTVGLDTRCPNCAAMLHCCRTCQHFNTAARWQCSAEIEQQVNAKNDANACPQYGPRLVLDSTGRRPAAPGRASNDPRSQFDNLFKR